jgi:U4/U6.U5 tri-snRNP-associated protein 1
MDAAEIEQTNKLRKSLGLAPLPVPGAPTESAGPAFRQNPTSDSDEEPASTLETREAAGYGNWKQLQEDEVARKRRSAKAAAVKHARDAAQRFARLEGKGLGDLDDSEDLDAKAWLKGSSKRAKKIEKERARKLKEELLERERLAAIEYSAKDLAGVRVAHEVGDFEAAEGDQILTLKDAGIEENEEEGDELENLDLKAQEKLKEKLELKKRKPVYDPNAVDEDGNKAQILSQYDDEISGRKRKLFMLNDQDSSVEKREGKGLEIGEILRAQPISLDISKEQPVSDYMDISEVKIKKPKKAKKSTRQRTIDGDGIFPAMDQINQEAMEIDSAAAVDSKPNGGESSVTIDDDDLAASLAVQRRNVLKKRKRVTPADIARQLQDESTSAPEKADDDAEVGLIIDDTTEFVANLQRPTFLEAQSKPKRLRSAEHEAAGTSSDDEEGDVEMRDNVDVAKSETPVEAVKTTATGLEEEATLDQGVGAAVNLLRQRGLVNISETGNANALDRDRELFLREKKQFLDAAEQRLRYQRQRDRDGGTFERMSAKEREEYARFQNKQSDQYESRQLAQLFDRDYKPNVQLKYIDEFGRSVGPKEAFKHLSHQFHGKGSGKQKTEKQLKKVEDEKKREAQSALDASQATGMNNAMGTTAKKNKQAGVRLG